MTMQNIDIVKGRTLQYLFMKQQMIPLKVEVL